MKPRITSILVNAEFPCQRCGKPCERITCAPWDGKAIGEPEPVEAVCNACERLERNAEAKERDRRNEQRRWAEGKVKGGAK